MSYQLLFHPQAEKEYSEAYQWYEQQQKGLGDRFEQMVDHRLQQIIQHPEYYKISKAPFREASIETFPFTIVYKSNKKRNIILISAIYHNKRNPKYKYRK